MVSVGLILVVNPPLLQLNPWEAQRSERWRVGDGSPGHRAGRERATALGSRPDHAGVRAPLAPFAFPLPILLCGRAAGASCPGNRSGWRVQGSEGAWAGCRQPGRRQQARALRAADGKWFCQPCVKAAYTGGCFVRAKFRVVAWLGVC